MIETARLILRPWREADRAPFAALNADPEVMAHFPAPLSRAESDATVDRLAAAFEHQTQADGEACVARPEWLVRHGACFLVGRDRGEGGASGEEAAAIEVEAGRCV